jgi:isopenicillin N synthase-like dioxygenase
MVSQSPVLANLHTIRYQKLLDNEPQELSRLLNACQTDGFFYLDLRSASLLLDLYRNLMTLTEKYFDQPVESKLLDVVSDVRG